MQPNRSSLSKIFFLSRSEAQRLAHYPVPRPPVLNKNKDSAELSPPLFVVPVAMRPSTSEKKAQNVSLSVVVADDHELLREGIVAIVAREPGFAVCGCATDPSAALALVAKHHPDLLIMDVFLGGQDSLRLVQELATCYPETRILALSAFEDSSSTHRFIRAGAKGLLVKSVTGAHLIDAIRTVASGGTYTGRRSHQSEGGRTRPSDNGR